jgi:hypothetical protein
MGTACSRGRAANGTSAHPEDGFLSYEQVTFDLAGQPDLKVTVLVGPRPGAR